MTRTMRENDTSRQKGRQPDSLSGSQPAREYRKRGNSEHVTP